MEITGSNFIPMHEGIHGRIESKLFCKLCYFLHLSLYSKLLVVVLITDLFLFQDNFSQVRFGMCEQSKNLSKYQNKQTDRANFFTKLFIVYLGLWIEIFR